MVSHQPKQRRSRLGSALAVAALAAISCGGDSGITNTNQASTDPAVSCAQKPNAPECTAPSNGNASTILVMVQPVGGTPGSAAAMPPASTPTTPPASAPTFPTRPRPPAAGAAAPGTGIPTMVPPNTGAPVAAGTAAPPPAAAGAAGSTAPAGAAGAAAPGMNLAGITDEELSQVRQVCVDEINMYRATLPNLQPMKRASAAQENCSDRGAQMDGDSGMAHGSVRAGLCRSVGLFSENTCPGYPVGGRSGMTLADALKFCLKQMWAEGEPPVSRAECMKDTAGCFQAHGHYLNMSNPSNLVASCGFYKMKTGAYWMNQDFAAR